MHRVENNIRRILLIAGLDIVFFLSCSRPDAPPASTTGAGALRPGVVSPPGPVQSPASVTAAIAYDLPAGWKRVKPSSSMRLDQAEIPGPGGAGQMAFFFFGTGRGGSGADNLSRWEGQVQSSKPPVRNVFDANGLHITWTDVSGTLLPSSIGMAPSAPQPDSRLLAAVVEGTGGPWFVKATGPKATMAAAHDPFVAMLRSMHASSSDGRQ
ncbi:MAG: hypothetical protein ABI718_15870 [Acidobacteriota bacterium]